MRIVMLLAMVAAVGCTKKPKATGPAPAESAPPASTNYQPGGGAVQNIRQAPRRTFALNDLRSVGQLVEIEYNEQGKMPTAERMKEIAKSVPNVAAGIEDGTLVVTGTTDHGGVWIHEADAPEKGGIALAGGVASRYDSAELTAKLKQ